MELDIFLQILEKYDLPTIILGAAFFVYIKRKLMHVDQAVNNRDKGGLTLSQEVSEIHRKVDVQAVEISHIKKEIDLHREVDEKAFLELANDINLIKLKKVD